MLGEIGGCPSVYRRFIEFDFLATPPKLCVPHKVLMVLFDDCI